MSTKKSTKSKGLTAPLNVVYVLVLVLLASLFGNAYQYAKSNHLYRFAEDAVNSNPLLTGVNPAKPIPGKPWTLVGKSLGSKKGQVVFKHENETIPAKVEFWSDVQILVKVPENLKIDTTYLVEVSTVEQRTNGDTLTFPIIWENGGEYTTDSDHYLYTVQTGDSLYKIARDELGSEARFEEIIELNRVSYPGLSQYSPLSLGMELKLPNE
ncbi:MAG: LysM peptidoglycan-binding domain-containing protein [Patescibacteria group bacterium]